MDVLSLDKPAPEPFFRNDLGPLWSLLVFSGVRGVTELFLMEADLGGFSSLK